MKRLDDSTKKLIKNVVALITSALVLIAATVAWFASGTKTSVGQIKASVKASNYSVSYYKMKDDSISGFLQSVTTDADGTVGSITFSPAQSDLAYKMDDTSAANSKWTQSTDWSITSMIPGAYWSYRIDVDMVNALVPKLVIEHVSCSPSANETTVLENVYLYAAVVQATEVNGVTSYTRLGSVCKPLSELIDPSTGKIDATLVNVPLSTGYTILVDIGIPGASVNGSSTKTAHDALRQIGATLILTSVNVVSG